jgi:hypothetical protein
MNWLNNIIVSIWVAVSSFFGIHHAPATLDTIASSTLATINQDASSSDAFVLYPSPGTMVHPGDTVNIKLVVPEGYSSSGNGDNPVFFSSSGDLQEVHSATGSYSLSWVVPDRLGKLEILASPVYSNTVKTYVISEPKSKLVSIDVIPYEKTLNTMNDFITFGVTGKYADGKTYDISGTDTGTSYSAEGAENVVLQKPGYEDGYFVPVQNGSGIIFVRNSGIWAGVPVIVDITNHAPQYLPTATTTVRRGETKEWKVKAFTDPDGDALETSLASVQSSPCFTPVQCSKTTDFMGTLNVVDNGNGEVTITMTPAPEDYGIYSIVLKTQDDGDPNLGGIGILKVKIE